MIDNLKTENSANEHPTTHKTSRQIRQEQEKAFKETMEKETNEKKEKYNKIRNERLNMSRRDSSGILSLKSPSPDKGNSKTKLNDLSKEYMDEIKRKNKARFEKPSKFNSNIDVPQDTYRRIQFVKNIFFEVDKFYQNIPTLQSLEDL